MFSNRGADNNALVVIIVFLFINLLAIPAASGYTTFSTTFTWERTNATTTGTTGTTTPTKTGTTATTTPATTIFTGGGTLPAPTRPTTTGTTATTTPTTTGTTATTTPTTTGTTATTTPTTTGTTATTSGTIAFTTGRYGTTTEQLTDTPDSDANYTPLLALVIVHSVVIIVLIIFIVVCGIYISRKLRGLEHRPDIHEQIHASAHDTERGEVAETSDATTEFTELAEIYTNTPGNRNSEHIYSSLATVGEYANTTTATLSDGVSGELRGSRSQKKGRGKASWQKKGKAYERNVSPRGQGVQAVESEANPDKLYVNMML
ncbi:uncharacterized protein [Littorina saxatilis]|uniref:uncharacterized protein n=1 Tax=Littorina saxatilis TaxID=31220 RepID=UPI0038B48BD8